ncbi:MAG TPA: hypothetical protein VNF72_08285, partial [Myxococcota bacterium]|nr:hypothetical protein [Myxococcota bacterium]
ASGPSESPRAAMFSFAARGDSLGPEADAANHPALDDRGVSLHTCSPGDGATSQEFLRFDCFDEDPHYHYISWRGMSNEMIHLDPIADGDPLAWALERIRTRLPQMLARAGAGDVAAHVDPAEIERALPRVAEAAYRARYHSDAGAVMRSALGSAA